MRKVFTLLLCSSGILDGRYSTILLTFIPPTATYYNAIITRSIKQRSVFAGRLSLSMTQNDIVDRLRVSVIARKMKM